MTLEQAIASYEKSAERYHKAFLHCKAHGGEFYQSEAESNKICYEHDRQLAAWLRELQERRKAPEIVTCGECVNFAERDFCKVAGHNVHRKSNCMQVFGAERRTDADD